MERALKIIDRAKKVHEILKIGKGKELVSYTPEEGWRIVEEYWLLEPFCKTFIIYNDETLDYKYIVVEPKLNDFELELLMWIKNELISYLESFEGEGEREEVVKSAVDKLLRDLRVKLSEESYLKLMYYILRDFVHYGKITPLMMDRKIEDVSCNGYGKPVFVFHRDYTNLETNVKFGEDELDALVIRLAQISGKHVSIAEPMVDAALPDGSRIQMTLGTEVSDHGSTFTIRKFRDEPITPVDLIAWGTFSSEQMAYLWLCIENRKNLIFAGGTASGKTSSMNAISLFIPKRAKIVSIEDTREVMLPHENWIPLVTREMFGEKGKIDMYELLRAALRQRPEYIIVGEVRGREALTLFQAMATGHTTYSTLHADSVSGVIHRLESPPIEVPRPMLEALDIISIQAQVYIEGRRVRRNVEIAEIVHLDPHTKMLRTSTIFQWDSVNDRHLLIGSSKVLEDIRLHRGWSRSELEEELERRRILLEFMVKHNIKDFESVSEIVHAYQSKPDRVLERVL